jgi:hypothetical protein
MNQSITMPGSLAFTGAITYLTGKTSHALAEKGDAITTRAQTIIIGLLHGIAVIMRSSSLGHTIMDRDISLFLATSSMLLVVSGAID